MADPQAAVLSQLRNIEARTGRSIAELQAAVAATGLAKHGERRSWLMQQLQLGYGDANAVVSFMGKPLPALVARVEAPVSAAAVADPLEAIYSGSKAALRPLHEALMEVLRGFGEFEVAPKKSYLSLRRKKQFLMVGPATKEALEIGLNVKTLPPDPRLKVMPPSSMCAVTTRIGHVSEIDAALKRWMKAAFDAAG
ncbi:MAG TPA: DUF5655 domain-containing protein [Rubrivivax sp.]|nr:DUF5655 domain-containing protein [Rubrivivax sp.]